MIKHISSQPIGIFDSGIGGLTVAQALVEQLPHENIIYFGDTAHLPYGDKSATTIQGYSLKIADLLLQQHCKLILIACYSASAAAYEQVKKHVASQAIVMNVIDPTIELLRNNYPNKHVGLIGTRQTVHSNVHKKKIDSHAAGIQLTSLATNLLASAIEEFGNNKVIESLLEEYLSHASFKNLDALLLACTHYPIVKAKIARYFNPAIDIIDPSETVALAVKDRLAQENLLHKDNKDRIKHFYVSDYTDSFAANAKRFFGEEIHLEHYLFPE